MTGLFIVLILTALIWFYRYINDMRCSICGETMKEYGINREKLRCENPKCSNYFRLKVKQK